MAQSEKLPVVLLTGFLGSGKTRLLNALLKTPGFAHTAVIVNELGEIGLDHALVESSADNVVLLEAGCLCCTIADSLHETLAGLQLRRTRGEVPGFKRVVIETTGLADPAPILNTLLGNRLVTDHYRLDAVVVTADALHFLEELERNSEVAKQVAVADRLVITKTDLASAAQLGAVRARLAGLNARARVFESHPGDAALASFSARDPLQARAVPLEEPRHDVNRHDPHIIAHAVVLDGPVSWSGIAAWCRIVVDKLGDRLLRCKGLVEIAESGEVVFLQGVQRIFHTPERLPRWPDADHRSRLVCITRDVDPAELRSMLPALRLPAGSDPHVRLEDLVP